MNNSLNKKNIVVLMGGSSSEREVSLSSGKNVFNALIEIGMKVNSIDCCGDFIPELRKINPDICFNALHGGGGENGEIQSILEKEKIPYTHSGVISSILAMNKMFSKNLFIENNINTPLYEIIKINNLTAIERKLPFVIKPINEGSSKGVYTILNESDKNNLEKIQNSWLYGDEILIEDYIEGKEITCSVYDGNVTEVMEVFTKNSFYDYEAKYIKGASKHIVPAKISSEIYELVQEISLKSHNIFGCKGVTRSDFRFNEKLGNKGLFILEINTQPGMTPTSLVPELVGINGISYNSLVLLLLEDASCNR